MNTHHRLSPSDSARWMSCPGSINATIDSPRTSSVFSAEGTALHQVRSECLELGIEASRFVGQTLTVEGHAFRVTQDWAKWLQPGIDRINEIGDQQYIEKRVPLAPWIPGGFGTMDSAVISPDGRTLYVDDFKGGAGEPVAAPNNSQLRIYALGMLRSLEDTVARQIETVVLSIDQPRVSSASVEQVETLTVAELLAFGETVKAAAEATYKPDAKRVPGAKQCRWCPAKTSCPEHAELMMSVAGLAFDNLDLTAKPAPMKAVSAEYRSWVVKHGQVLKSYVDALAAETLEAALRGDPTPGLKAVVGRRPARQWNAPDERVEALLVDLVGADRALSYKVISPSQAESSFTTDEWQTVQSLVSHGQGKPTLVPEDDKRPAIAVGSQFENLDEETGNL